MPTLPPAFRTVPIAHRALHDAGAGCVENSARAVRAAVAAGVGIEIDIQPSADRTAMVFHDFTLDRLTARSGPIRAVDTDTLCSTPLAGGAGDTIPTLAQVLDWVGGQVPLLIEIKDQSANMGPVDGALEEAVAHDLAGYEGPVAVMSFNPASVAAFAEAAPEVPRGLTTMAAAPAGVPPDRAAAIVEISAYDQLGASFISHHHVSLDHPRIRVLRAAGATILTWTIRTAEEERLARRFADNITFEGYTPA